MRWCSVPLDTATAMADAALDSTPGSALVYSERASPVRLRAVDHRYGALVGLNCPPGIRAVAACHEVRLSGDRGDDARIGVAVLREEGVSVARLRLRSLPPKTLTDLEGPLVDVAHRAMGLPTPRCTRSVLELLDAAFADDVLARTLAADLGTRPTWTEISSSHPLAAPIAVMPAELRARRLTFALELGWSAFREAASASPGSSCFDMPPDIVRWLDDGAFARWLFARYPEPEQVFADVCELLDPTTADALRAAHGRVEARER